MTNCPDEAEIDTRDLSIKTQDSHRTLLLSETDYQLLNYYIEHARPLPENGSRILFVSTADDHTGLCARSYQYIANQIYRSLAKFTPDFTGQRFVDSIDRLHPHTLRHTWAFNLLSELMDTIIKRNCGRRIKGDLEEAKDQLRTMGGWSPTSKMPIMYAKRYLSESANDINIQRIKNDEQNFSTELVNALKEEL